MAKILPNINKVSAEKIGNRIILRDLSRYNNSLSYLEMIEAPHGYYAQAYEFESDKVIKIFKRMKNSFLYAESEHDNLEYICELNDSKITVPKPFEIVEVTGIENSGMTEDLGKEIQDYDPEEKFYGVIMEKISGESIEDMKYSHDKRCRKPFGNFINAMIEHELWKYDMKQLDLIYNEEKDKIIILDTHNIAKGWQNIYGKEILEILYRDIIRCQRPGSEKSSEEYFRKTVELLDKNFIKSQLPEKNVLKYTFYNIKKGYSLLEKE